MPNIHVTSLHTTTPVGGKLVILVDFMLPKEGFLQEETVSFKFFLIHCLLVFEVPYLNKNVGKACFMRNCFRYCLQIPEGVSHRKGKGLVLTRSQMQ